MEMDDYFEVALEVMGFFPSCSNVAECLSKAKNTISTVKDMPYKLLLSKIYKVLEGMYYSSYDKVKLATKLHEKIDNDKSKQLQFISWVDGIQDMRKIKYYSSLFYCYLVLNMEEELLFKLISILARCTSYDLDYIRDCEYEKTVLLDTRISYMLNDNLFEICDDTVHEVRYKLSSLAKALKQNSLNYEDKLGRDERILSIESLHQYAVTEPMTDDDINEIVEEPKFFKCSLDALEDA